MDFTIARYKELLTALKRQNYTFLTFEQYCECKNAGTLPERYVVLRHDVDLRAQNSLRLAQIEHAFGVRASYYFRVVKQSNCPDVIRRIASLEHEIGYHYEDMSLAKGNVEMAYQHFVENLAYFRTFYPVRTICMHGAPTSRYDGRDLWKSYDYRSLGIIGEPYFDVDYRDVFYLTDTGRCWDGYRFSVRDKVPEQQRWIEEGRTFHTTEQLVKYINGLTDDKVVNMLITTHPQRWTDRFGAWMKELLVQNLKNQIKRCLVKR